MIKPIVALLISLNITVSLKLEATDTYKLPSPVISEKNQVQISVLPQVELISIVQVISKYREIFGFLMTHDSTRYLYDVNSHFMSFRTHPAVKMLERLSLQPRMFNFSAPSNIMLMTDGSFDLKTDIIEDGFVVNRIGGKDSLRLFLKLLKDFSIKSSFNDFFSSHREFYMSIINKTIDNLSERNYVRELEDFYGKAQKSYGIVLVSLYGPVGFGNSITFNDGRRGIYNAMGPRSVANSMPTFGDEKYLKYMIMHEFSHPFINPLTEKYWPEIKDFASNYELIPEVARKNVCGDWQECINEFVIRSVTTYLALNEGNGTGEEFYKKEKERGVSCIDQLLEKIRLFQSDRKSYPTFDEYYSQILNVFKDL